jgi:mannan polymerase II complex MNN11 subunit
MRKDMVLEPFPLSPQEKPTDTLEGYSNFFTNTTAYTSFTDSFPQTWSLIPAVRHALTLHPYSPWMFALSPYALIMDPSLSLHSHILSPPRLASLMLKDIPVVPPDSVIHTFSHLKPEKVDFILTQDAESLSHGSFLLRKGEWARFFLDSWGDLLYRKYNFQKAEKHALVRSPNCIHEAPFSNLVSEDSRLT